LVGKVGAEEDGIERVPPEARRNQHPRDLFSLSHLVTAALPPLLSASLGPARLASNGGIRVILPSDVSNFRFLAILVGDIIGSIGPAVLITLGPKTGLRCMTLTRYSFGIIPGGFLAFLNVLTCIGWSMVNTMAGAQAFYAMTNTKLPLVVCILILAIGAFIVSFLGYKWIHF
jgi:hypothetical protein